MRRKKQGRFSFFRISFLWSTAFCFEVWKMSYSYHLFFLRRMPHSFPWGLCACSGSLFFQDYHEGDALFVCLAYGPIFWNDLTITFCYHLHFLSIYIEKLLKRVCNKKNNHTNKKSKKKYQHKEYKNGPTEGHFCLCLLFSFNFVFALVFDLGRDGKRSCIFSNYRLLSFYFGYNSNNLRTYIAWKLVKCKLGP